MATAFIIAIAVIMAVLGFVGFLSSFSGLSIDELMDEWRNQKDRNG